MAALAKLMCVAMVAVIPGGLVVLFLVILARAVRQGLLRESQHGRFPSRLARAVAAIRMHDVVREARAVL